jgi:predicted transcriptional regulator
VFESSMFLEEDEDASGEVEVLFYAYENEVRTAMLEPDARSVLRTLGECHPCSLEELHERVDLATGLQLDEVQEILLDSAETGIVAFS